MINISVLLCLAAGLFGVYALIRHFCILKPRVYTNIYNAMPIIIGTVAWLSEAVTFYQAEHYESPINIQRVFVIASWIIMIYRLIYYRHKLDKYHNKMEQHND